MNMMTRDDVAALVEFSEFALEPLAIAACIAVICVSPGPSAIAAGAILAFISPRFTYVCRRIARRKGAL